MHSKYSFLSFSMHSLGSILSFSMLSLGSIKWNLSADASKSGSGRGRYAFIVPVVKMLKIDDFWDFLRGPPGEPQNPGSGRGRCALIIPVVKMDKIDDFLDHPTGPPTRGTHASGVKIKDIWG